MLRSALIAVLALGLSLSTSFAQDDAPRPRVKMTTSIGVIVVELYNETPQHRDNFLKLAGEGFYDGTLFHRVISGFMAQGGDPQSVDAAPGMRLGTGGPGYTIESEIDPAFIHVKGALAAARQGDQVNPQRRSSGSQFYIVQGRDVSPQMLQNVVNSKRGSMLQPHSYTPDQIAAYQELGGTPHLDMQYTVFGRVIEGLEVVDAICAVQTDRANRPNEDVDVTMEILH
ncbi:MAG: peptidylprolyl isomerase [Flavobacteriales bacterium]|nr:peptidylprolyl isomerase [Flavobacteriales bacterium]